MQPQVFGFWADWAPDLVMGMMMYGMLFWCVRRLNGSLGRLEDHVEEVYREFRGRGDGDGLTLAGLKEKIAASEVRTEKAIQRVEQQTVSLGKELRGDIRDLGKELNDVEVRLSVKVGQLEVGYAAPQVRERAVDDD